MQRANAPAGVATGTAPCLSQQPPGRQVQLTEVCPWPKARPLPGQWELLPNSWVPVLTPTWGCTEDTAMSSTLNTPLWPSTQRMPGSATCGRDTPVGTDWPSPTGQATSSSHFNYCNTTASARSCLGAQLGTLPPAQPRDGGEGG